MVNNPVDVVNAENYLRLLQQSDQKLQEEEVRYNMLLQLQKRGLFTRDILSFGIKQAGRRTYAKGIDTAPLTRAMASKIKDSKRTLAERRIINKQIRRDSLHVLQNRRFLLRKVNKRIKEENMPKIAQKHHAYAKKIEHLKRALDCAEDKTPFNPTFDQQPLPTRLKDYEGLRIFKGPKELPEKQDPVGPFVCHAEIELNLSERRLLSKDPKYSLMTTPTEEEFVMEYEKAFSKHRFGQQNEMDTKKAKKENLHTKLYITGLPNNFSEVNTTKSTLSTDLNSIKSTLTTGLDSIKSTTTSGHESSMDPEIHYTDSVGQRDNTEDLIEGQQSGVYGDVDAMKRIWSTESHRYPFDPFVKTMNFSSNRPTDYKMNRRIKLPKPLDTEDEYKCDLRRRSLQETFREFNNLGQHKKTSERDLKKGLNIENLNKDEQIGLRSLCKRVKNKEIMIVPTDKSGRFAVMTFKQYMDSGFKHTNKDEKLDWDRVKYMKNQINNHMAWVSNIISYADDTDKDRMHKNLTVPDLELPEMNILVKDHKTWTPNSNQPVPSRPVVSGNNSINTHVSELLSELIEPIVAEYNGAEIQSTEEALSMIDKLNELIESGTDYTGYSVLDAFSQQRLEPCKPGKLRGKHQNDNLMDIYQNISNNLENNVSDYRTCVEADKETLEDNQIEWPKQQKPDSEVKTSIKSTLTTDLDSIKSTLTTDLDSIKSTTTTDHESSSSTLNDSFNSTEEEVFNTLCDLARNRKSTKGKITDFFEKTRGNDTIDHTTWLSTVASSARQDYELKKGITLNERLRLGAKSGEYWSKSLEMEQERWLQVTEQNNLSDNKVPLQNEQSQAILFGTDVVGLYPNLDGISVGAIAYKAAKQTKIKFERIKFSELIIYLLLVLGQPHLKRFGLENCIPRRKDTDKDPQSLASSVNKNLNNWNFDGTIFTDDNKTTMIALLIQTLVLLMTTTTCYTFGGNIYRQRNGLGIGLRGSAALARLTMCIWDATWGKMQGKLGLTIKLFFRYIDDVRLYLKPLNRGWYWVDKRWKFLPDTVDDRSDEQYTIEEVGKSLESVWEFLKFTCESQEDFTDGFLPTLDFKTRVKTNGMVEYIFYRKPMANNLVLQHGTALSKGCVYSSLRQELVRMLLNTDLGQGIETRIELVEQFTQLLVNSGHHYRYIKSIIMQALTKFSYMVQRNNYPVNHKKYMPLHRSKSFHSLERKLLKYAGRATWFMDEKFGDKFKDSWKTWIVKKENRHVSKMARVKLVPAQKLRVPTTTTLFVPKTKSGKLADMVAASQQVLDPKIGWKMKIIEKPGIPLFRKFTYKFPMNGGCIRGTSCNICDNDGRGCRIKNVVYTATCKKCLASNEKAVYVGETSRYVGTRAAEHFQNLIKFKKDSFILEHWMSHHGTETNPPKFNFRVTSSHRDPLGRQLREAIKIRSEGVLNKREEFATNELINLEVSKYNWKKNAEFEQRRLERNEHDNKLQNFIVIMKRVHDLEQSDKNIFNVHTNEGRNFRLHYKRPLCEQSDHRSQKRARMLASSTPKDYRQREPVDLSNSSVASSPSTCEGSNASIDASAVLPTLSSPGVTNNMGGLKVKTPEKLDQIETVSRDIVAKKEQIDAEVCYRKRTSSLPSSSSCRLIIKPGILASAWQEKKKEKAKSLSDLMGDLNMDEWDNKFKRFHEDSRSLEYNSKGDVTEEKVDDKIEGL